MSLRPTRPALVPLRLARASGVLKAGEWNAIASELERADGQNQKRGDEPRFASILLQAPGGEAWRLSVDDAGALVTVAVPRT